VLLLENKVVSNLVLLHW